MDSRRRAHDHISAVVAAHGALTEGVVWASQLTAAEGRKELAGHLDRHRSELNLAIGEFAMWAASFGEWARVDVGHGIHPAMSRPPIDAPGAFGADLLSARERLKARRGRVLTELANARSVLRAEGLPVDELTAYRRMVRLWAGEAVDVVTAAHRLTLADRYIHWFGQLRADAGADGGLRRKGVALLRQWMHDLEEPDREGELILAATCGYGDLVEYYREELAS